ncbi:MAG: TetR/AcrR family transcriptional regulator [Bdellovibrionales bacterium]|nr:TetR/AcrR family transcriptional regulator [Bdellovibrionales bacterium]
MTKEACETRIKILEVASHLFARFGYEGTSIRDIAGKAEVNIAAINYHFKNKQSLYWQIYEMAHHRLSEDMKAIAAQEDSLVAFCLRVFDLMLKNGDMVKNTFKLILSDSIPEPEGEMEAFCANPRRVGPPGGEIMLAVIEKELGQEVCEAGKYWAVRVLFSSIAHWALMHSTSYLKKACQSNPDIAPDRIRHLISLHVEATLAYLQTHGKDQARFMGTTGAK